MDYVVGQVVETGYGKLIVKKVNKKTVILSLAVAGTVKVTKQFLNKHNS